MRRLALPRNHGAEALLPVQPLSGWICPEAVSSRTMGCFRVSQKLGQKNPLSADKRELVTNNLIVKKRAHERSEVA